MFGRLGRFVVHHPVWVIVTWLVAAASIAVFAPSLDEVVNRDQANFLPSSYESVRAGELAQRAFQESAATRGASAIVVVRRADGQPLAEPDQAKVAGLAEALRSAAVPGVTSAVTGPQAVAPNRTVQLISVGLTGRADDRQAAAAVQKIRQLAGPALKGSGLSAAVTGDVALFVDNNDAFDRGLVIVSIATIALIIGLLLLIYRSPIAALLPVVSVAVVATLSVRLIALVARAFDLRVDQSLQIILTIVLYGIGTDYILFLLFRYRERLRAGDPSKSALVTAVQRIGEVITSAAAAVVIVFLALVLAVFGAFRSLGPALAIAVVLMALAALTLVPAIVSLLGPVVFWPSRSWQRTPKGTTFQRLGRFTARRPAAVALASGGVLAALALGMLGFRTDYDQLAQLPDTTESARGLRDLQAGFPAGALNPTTVYLSAESTLDPAALRTYVQQLSQVPGVGAAMPAGPDGSPARISPDGKVARIDLLLSSSPYSNQALELAGGALREVAHAQAPPGTTALVGGVSSAFADIRDANNRDLRVIFPVAGLLIAVILALLLRSLVAPLYLMAAVVLGFFATLGSTVLLFQGVGGKAGLSFQLPIILYLFVVAIGTDYNILMIARLREEARDGRDPRTAADLAIEHGGPSVGAAGLILAGTFGSLLLAGVAFLTEMGFAVSVGIVLSAFVMAMFLVPSVTALLGHKAWWPGHGDEPQPVAQPELDAAGVG
jgi:RND superfamily putative drug exporter